MDKILLVLLGLFGPSIAFAGDSGGDGTSHYTIITIERVGASSAYLGGRSCEVEVMQFEEQGGGGESWSQRGSCDEKLRRTLAQMAGKPFRCEKPLTNIFANNRVTLEQIAAVRDTCVLVKK